MFLKFIKSGEGRKKVGFTLIELLAVIVILAIIISISLIGYTDYMKSSREKIVKIEEKNLINAASLFYLEYNDDSDYIKETVIDGNQKKVYSCVSLKSLIEQGFFKDNVNFSKSEITKEDTIIRISTVNGINSYEILNDYDKDNVCTFYKLKKSFDNVSISSSAVDEEPDGLGTAPPSPSGSVSSITFGSDILTISKKEDSYMLNLNVTYDFAGVIDKDGNLPVYVLLVLDKSGSMSGTKYNKSKAAAIALSEQVVGISENSYVGLIQFGTDVETKEFRHVALVDEDFTRAGGNTNIIAALDEAIDMMAMVPETALKYVILLSDGNPEPISSKKLRFPWGIHYTICRGKIQIGSECENKLMEYRNKLERYNAKFTIIGYSMRSESYKRVASVDNTSLFCPGGAILDGERHCYYESNSVDIDSLFSNLSDAIITTTGMIDNGKIRGTYNDAITVYDPDTKEKITELELVVDFNQNVEKVNKLFKYNFDINNVGFDCQEEHCNFQSDLITDLRLDLYDVNGQLLQSLNLNSPKLFVDATKTSYMN